MEQPYRTTTEYTGVKTDRSWLSDTPVIGPAVAGLVMIGGTDWSLVLSSLSRWLLGCGGCNLAHDSFSTGPLTGMIDAERRGL